MIYDTFLVMIVKGGKWLRLMMVNATFSNISAYIVAEPLMSLSPQGPVMVVIVW
jgi:hypothetical protein